MPDILGLRWKIATAAGVLALAIAAFFLLQAQIENRHLLKQNVQLDARINDKSTGYVAQLAQATTNVKQLESALDTQNQRLREQAAASATELSALSAQVAEVQRENQTLRAASAHIMDGKPKGDDLTARIGDIDTRILETLK